MAVWRLRAVTTPVDALLSSVLVAMAVVESMSNDSAPDPQARAVFAAIAAASVALRRTHATFAAVILAAAMAVETWTTEAPDEVGVLFACLIVSYSVGAHAPRREAFLGASLITMAVAVSIAADPSDSISNIPPSVLLFVGLPFALGLAMRRRQLDIVALELRTSALVEEADRAVDAERGRIARELHDVVSHAVTLIAVQAEAGQAVLDQDPESARRSLAAIGQVSREALTELSRLLAVLREDEAEVSETGLAQIGSLLEGGRAAGLDVTLSQSGTPATLDPEVDRCAYRIIQEGLTNALRHTSDARVRITVEHHPTELVVRVSSAGTPHASSYGGAGRGLSGLRERVAGLGGRFEAGAGADGFDVRAALPTTLRPATA